jgi:hypothetical protein
LEIRLEKQLRKAYERTDWEKVGEKKIYAAMLPLPRMESEAQLDQTVINLIEVTRAAVKKHTPQARPCPYSKRWFTPELKTQQVKINRARRK